MSDVVYRNVCLVCGEILPLDQLTTHLNQNVGHAVQEVMMRADDETQVIAINNRKPAVVNEWENQCKTVASIITQTGNELFSIDSAKTGWRDQRHRVQFKEPFPMAPTVTFDNIVYTDSTDLLLVESTNEYFEISFRTKNPSSGELPTVGFSWEATNG